MPRSTSQLDVDWLLGAPAPSRPGRLRAAMWGLVIIGGLTGAVVTGWPSFSQRWLHRELVDGWQAALIAEDSQRALDLLEPLARLLPESLPQMAAALGHPDEWVRRAAYRHLEGFIDRSHTDPGGDRSLRRLVDHLGGIQPELPVTGQLLLTGLLSRTLAVLVSQPAAEGGELVAACQNLMDAAHGRLRANRRVMYQVDNLAASLAPPLAPLPGLTTQDDSVQNTVRDTAVMTEFRSVAAPADSVAIGRDQHALGHSASGGGRARVAVSDPPGQPQGGEGVGAGGAAVDSASPSSSRPTTRSGSTASRLGGAGQVARERVQS
jgi:hypothetical protein